MSRKITQEYSSLMKMIGQSGLNSRTDRLHISSLILDKTVDSFQGLTDDDIAVLHSVFSSWQTIQRERFYTGAIHTEALMLRTKHTLEGLGDTDVFSTPRIRKDFLTMVKKLDITNPDTSDDSGVSNFDAISSELANAGIETMEVISHPGRWDEEYIINPPTASLGLMLRTGGFPRGRITHLYGKTHAGKSMLSQAIMGQAQKQGIPVVFIDVEAAMTGEFANSLGIDTTNEKLWKYFVPENLEQISKIVRAYAKSNALIVLDSIAAGESQKNADRVEDDKAEMVGGNARLWAQTLNLARNQIVRSQGSIILINQVRSNMDAGMYGKKTRPWGAAAIHHSEDISIEITQIKEADNLASKGYVASKMTVDKNRFGDRGASTTLTFYPGKLYYRSLDVLRSSSMPITSKSDQTFGEISGNTLRAGFIANEDGTDILPRKGRYTLRVDPVLMAAIRENEEDFNGVDVEPAKKFDAQHPGHVDEDKSVYFTIPKVGEGVAATWFSKHPVARVVIEQRLLDSLDERFEIIQDMD